MRERATKQLPCRHHQDDQTPGAQRQEAAEAAAVAAGAKSADDLPRCSVEHQP